jgi:uncharacterized protein (TIGR02145 family)
MNMKKKLTKTGLFFALAFICTNIVSAQNYMITFSGSGQSNVVEAVEVKNTTQQTSVTLNGTDTLHLVDVVGINPIIHENAAMKVYPNPTRHTSRVEFYNSEAGNVTVEIIDITGKTLSILSVNLSRGLQAFEIHGLGSGIYLLKATTETIVQQQRLITYSQNFGNPQINYLGSFDLSMTPAQMKSTKNIVEMQYNDGERLVTKGISGDYSHTMSLIPSESQNIDFDFIECVDGDGNHYGVVTIGDQCWMKENLKTTQYRNGTPIEYPGADNTAWANDTIGAYAWYNNDINWKDSYGALYNWHAVNNTNGLCPTGWHVPSDAEWTLLIDYVVSQGFPNQWDNPNGAGNALKSCRQVNSPLGGDCNTTEHPRWEEDTWSGNNHHGFDEFGFSGLPGGFRYSSGNFYNVGGFGYWWSSTEDYTSYAWFRKLTCGDGSVDRFSDSKTSGFSVLCLRD